MTKSKRNSLMIFLLSFLVFLAITVWGKYFLQEGDEMGFVLLNFYLVMPALSFLSAMILFLKKLEFKWLYPLVFGLLGILIPPLILANSWDWISIFFSLTPALLGGAIGYFVENYKDKSLA